MLEFPHLERENTNSINKQNRVFDLRKLFFCEIIRVMNEYKLNQLVMHFREGLSLISEVKEMEGTEYFIVTPQHEGGEKIYVPVSRADAIIRPIISKDAVPELVEFMKNTKPEYFSNTKQRRDVFKRRLGSGDIHDLAYLAMLLYFFRHPEELDNPVKFGPADVEMLKYATRTLYDELAIALEMDRAEVEEYIVNQIKR